MFISIISIFSTSILYMINGNSREKGFISSHNLQSTTKTRQDRNSCRNLGVVPETEMMQRPLVCAAYWLDQAVFLNNPELPAQGGIAYRRLGPTTSIINHKKALQKNL